MKRPFTLWLLAFGLLFLGLGGLYGGINMLLDPSGKLLSMDVVLPQLGVPSYFLPGLFLIFIMGLLPLSLIYCLWTQPQWPWLKFLSEWNQLHWSWSITGLLAMLLFGWLLLQGMLIGFIWPIQYITALNGIWILFFLILPSTRRYASLPTSENFPGDF